MRVAYDSNQKAWKHSQGYIPEITAKEIDGSYYFWMEERKWLLRFPDGFINGDESLGEILDPDGKKIGEIPQFIPPDFKGPREYFKSGFGWIQGKAADTIDMAIFCPDPGDLRLRYNFEDGTFRYFGEQFR